MDRGWNFLIHVVIMEKCRRGRLNVEADVEKKNLIL